MKTLLAIALGLVGIAAPAAAADMQAPEAVTELPPGFSWTGAYIGAQAGYGWGDSSAIRSPVYARLPYDPDGFLGGVYVGFNYQFPNNIVLGLEGDVAISTMDGSTPGYLAGGIVDPALSGKADVNWTGAARLRAGYAFDRFLPYVAGGVAFADMDHTLVGPLEAYRFSGTYTGWTIGAGLEYALTDNVILRSEYRYTDFGSADFAVPTGEENKVDLKSHDVRIGISYKF